MTKTYGKRFFVQALFAAGLLMPLGDRAFAATDWPADKLVVSAEWLKGQIANEDLVVLHVGQEEAYRTGHIEGARFMRMDAISKRDPAKDALFLEMPAAEDLRKGLESLGVSDRSKVVVYFENGMIPPATRVVFTFYAAGLGDRVRLLDGGYAAWQQAKYPTASTAPVAKPGALSALKMQSRIVDAGFVQEHLGKPGYTVIDARLPAFYSGERTGGSADQPHLKGHIKGAISVPFSSVVDTEQKLKSADEIIATFRAAGLKSGDRAVVYCHIGQQATVVAFAARAVGIDAVLYDGSFQDWSQRGLPVEATPAPGAK